jgi:hypothetical protein
MWKTASIGELAVVDGRVAGHVGIVTLDPPRRVFSLGRAVGYCYQLSVLQAMRLPMAPESSGSRTRMN